MVSAELDPAALTRAATLVDSRYRPIAILLYGSYASGAQSLASDVDLGILFGGAVPDAFALAGLRTDLEAILGHGVDVVALDTASPILRMELLRNHRVLQKRDPERFETFVVRTLGEYFDLKRVREPIERALFAAESP